MEESEAHQPFYIFVPIREILDGRLAGSPQTAQSPQNSRFSEAGRAGGGAEGYTMIVKYFTIIDTFRLCNVQAGGTLPDSRDPDVHT